MQECIQRMTLDKKLDTEYSEMQYKVKVDLPKAKQIFMMTFMLC